MSMDRKELEESRAMKCFLIFGIAILLGQGIGYLLEWCFPDIPDLFEIASVAGTGIGLLFVDIKPLRILKMIAVFLCGFIVFGKIMILI